MSVSSFVLLVVSKMVGQTGCRRWVWTSDLCTCVTYGGVTVGATTVQGTMVRCGKKAGEYRPRPLVLQTSTRNMLWKRGDGVWCRCWRHCWRHFHRPLKLIHPTPTYILARRTLTVGVLKFVLAHTWIVCRGEYLPFLILAIPLLYVTSPMWMCRCTLFCLTELCYKNFRQCTCVFLFQFRCNRPLGGLINGACFGSLASSWERKLTELAPLGNISNI